MKCPSCDAELAQKMRDGMRSGSFLDRIRDLATAAIDPKPKPKF
jgi:hypothetical protein